MGPIGCPETSARKYRYTLLKTPKQHRPHLHRVGSLKSLRAQAIEVVYIFFQQKERTYFKFNVVGIGYHIAMCR